MSASDNAGSSLAERAKAARAAERAKTAAAAEQQAEQQAIRLHDSAVRQISAIDPGFDMNRAIAPGPQRTYTIFTHWGDTRFPESRLTEHAADSFTVEGEDFMLVTGYWMKETGAHYSTIPWTVERPCARCGQPTVPTQNYAGSDGHVVQFKSFGGSHLEQLGAMLAGRWLCGTCRAADYGGVCRACLRPWTDGPSLR